MTITDFFIRGDMSVEEIASIFGSQINDVAYWLQVFDYYLVDARVSDNKFALLCEAIDQHFISLDL